MPFYKIMLDITENLYKLTTINHFTWQQGTILYNK